MINPPNYIKIGIVRYVKDYDFTFKVYCKRRWIGMNILEFFSTEFIAYTREYYQDSILNGRITINKKIVDLDYTIKDNDLIEHKTVRREPPVFNLDIQTIFENEDLLVVNKPPSIPVHPCGQFHFNSVIHIIEHETNQKVYPVHRIDKLTSGVLILSKKLKNTYQLEQKVISLMNNMIVIFPYIACQLKNQNTISIQVFINNLDDQKTALTKFKKIWYDMWSDTTLLECNPITGRTHQIRVHCKYMGHPIINDICYGGPNIGNIILRDYCSKNYQKNQVFKKKIKLNDEEKTIFCYKNEIEDCFQWVLSDEHAMEIFLHSWKYQMGDLHFESQRPYWAQQDFNFSAISNLQM